MSNIFNIDDEFFVITSDNLNDIKTKLYGHAIQNNGIFENDDFDTLEADELSGNGAYIYVKRSKNSIDVYQDFNGSYGLFLFQQDNFFALSNSFFYLVNFLKNKFQLTFNKDFANYLISMDMCSEAVEDTLIKEIKILDKDAHVTIDIKTSQLSIDILDYEIDSVPLNSEQGLQILDNWFHRWTNLFRNVRLRTPNMYINLSGGFDSRITFCLVLMSGMDLNGPMINSLEDNLHTHKEDFEIASQIANEFNFKLNTSKFKPLYKTFSLDDKLNIGFNTRIPFHKHVLWPQKKAVNKFYVITGSGGETIRPYWTTTSDEHIESYLKRIEPRYSAQTFNEIKTSALKIFNKTKNIIISKYNISDDKSMSVPRFLYINTRSRHHFGSGTLAHYFANSYELSPLLDPELLKLKIQDDFCKDRNILIATIFTRYCPKLLEFKIEGNRKLDENTLQIARKLNEQFPVNLEKLLSKENDIEYNITTTDEKLLNTVEENTDFIPSVEEFLISTYNSDNFRCFIEKYFDSSIYKFAREFSEKTKWHPLSEIHPLIASATLLRHIENNQKTSEWLQGFQTNNKTFPFEKFCKARIDIQSDDYDIIDISKGDNNLRYPQWFQKSGKGAVIESTSMNLDLKIKSYTDSVIKIWLRGPDVADANRVRIPYWIDYTKLTSNGLVIFDEIKPTWHDKAASYSFNIKAGEIISLHIEWQPHIDTRHEI